MARRPDLEKERILTREDLKNLRHSLAHLSLHGVQDFYRRAWEECRLTSREFPSAHVIQQLVQAWKQLRKWR